MSDEDLKVRRPQPNTPRDTYIEGVQRRLLEHDKAFESMLDLIPADFVYGKEHEVGIFLVTSLSCFSNQVQG